MRSPWIRSAYCLLALGIFVYGCRRPPSGSVRNPAELTKLNGQVFVVTRGAANIRLGQLIVCITSLSNFYDLHLIEGLESKINEFTQQLEADKRRGDERETLVGEIKSNYSTLVKERDRLVPALSAAAILHEKYSVIRSEIKKRDQQLDNYAAQLRDLGTNSYVECDEIRSAASELVEKAADYAYEKLAPIKTCKTDADGRFYFEWPKGEEAVIFTRGHRDLPSGKAETYQWFVRVRAEPHANDQVLLTNDNLIDGPETENLFWRAAIKSHSIGITVPRSQDRIIAKRKNLPPEPRWAPPNTFYLLHYTSVTTPTGVVGLPAGSELREAERNSNRVAGDCGEVRCDVSITAITDNIDLATEVRKADSRIQAEIASWQAQQRDAEQQTRDVQNREYDEAHARIEEAYKRMHALTGESMLNQPPHQ